MTHTIYTCYDLFTGEIKLTKLVLTPEEYGDGVPEGMGFLMGTPHPDTHYIDTVTVEATERPEVAAMDGPTYDLATLPEGSKLVVTDSEDVTTDVPGQDDTLELTDTGTYQVKSVSPFPFIDFDVEIVI